MSFTLLVLVKVRCGVESGTGLDLILGWLVVIAVVTRGWRAGGLFVVE